MAGVTVVGLGTTALLLWGLSPLPLTPDAVRSLSASQATPLGASGGETVATALSDVAVMPGRWERVRVRMSHTTNGNATTLAAAAPSGSPPDHFVIGNGRGAGDGEIQMTPRWNLQADAVPARAGDTVAHGTISVALVGDLAGPQPTAAQLRQLEALLSALRERCDIAQSDVLLPPPPPPSPPPSTTWSATLR